MMYRIVYLVVFAALLGGLFLALRHNPSMLWGVPVGLAIAEGICRAVHKKGLLTELSI